MKLSRHVERKCLAQLFPCFAGLLHARLERTDRSKNTALLLSSGSDSRVSVNANTQAPRVEPCMALGDAPAAAAALAWTGPSGGGAVGCGDGGPGPGWPSSPKMSLKSNSSLAPPQLAAVIGGRMRSPRPHRRVGLRWAGLG